MDFKAITHDFMEEYLDMIGIPTKGFFNCINPDHPDINPSMMFDPNRGKCHCFSCNADYDLLDVIGIEEGIDTPGDRLKRAIEIFPEIAEYTDSAEDDFKEDLEQDGTPEAPETRKQSEPEPNRDTRTEDQRKHDRDILRASANSPESVKEWAKRGIGPGTVQRFNLGYEGNYDHFRRGSGENAYTGYHAPVLIIPSPEDPTAGVLRNIAPGVTKENRYDVKGPKQPFNTAPLRDNRADHVFICEGEIDGLSIYEAGQRNFTALGSAANARQFLKALEKPGINNKILILLLDNDSTGERTARELYEAIAAMHKDLFPFIPSGFYPDGVKDPNEYLQKAPAQFKTALSKALEQARKEKQAEQLRKAEEYRKGTSVLNVLGAFKDNLGRPTPIYPTGFPQMDTNFFGGGLHGRSLIIIGALSSAGKTTLIHQTADQIAESGKDVMIFSLEMSTEELIAKSISRLTYWITQKEGTGTAIAKTMLGITDGGRYSNYSSQEIDLIDRAVKYYEQRIAPYMFIFEGMGNVTVIPTGEKQEQPSIRERVEEHITRTGRRPVVVVDYLQILAPINDRATDKQNTDKNVLELKRIARDFNIPVIAISSMNRDSYGKPIDLSSYKESGAVEYSSDILLGLQFLGQSDKVPKKNGEGLKYKHVDIEEAKRRNPRDMELKLLKNRNGSMVNNTQHFYYYPMFNVFEERETPETVTDWEDETGDYEEDYDIEELF